MISVGEVVFLSSVAEIDIPSVGVISLKTIAEPARATAATIHLWIGGKESVLKEFAELRLVEVVRGKPKVVPVIQYVLLDDPRGLAFIGEFAVAYVDLAIGKAKTILKLFRIPGEYDPGFRRQEVIPLVQGFLLVYERGVARIEANGTVVWHQMLFADDLVERRDDEFLYYASEFGGDFALSIVDGRKIPQTSGSTS